MARTALALALLWFSSVAYGGGGCGAGCPGLDAANLNAHYLGLTSGCSDVNGLACTPGEVVRFTANNVNGCGCGPCVRTYQWSFGDGSTSSQTTVDHVFASGGRYSVSLVVTGCAVFGEPSVTIGLPLFVAGHAPTLATGALIVLAGILGWMALSKLRLT
jgi:hypothetical protein